MDNKSDQEKTIPKGFDEFKKAYYKDNGFDIFVKTYMALSEEQKKGFDEFKKAYHAKQEFQQLQDSYQKLDAKEKATVAKLAASYVLGKFYTNPDDIQTQLNQVRSDLRTTNNEIVDKLTPQQIEENKARIKKLQEIEAALILNKLALEFGSEKDKTQ